MDSKRRDPAANLTDDLIVEILSHLLAKSLCRFKCVSRSWRDLCSHPIHRKKLPQTLSGFFYSSSSAELFPKTTSHFINASGSGEPLFDPSFFFVSNCISNCSKITPLDCCNGLVLCSCRAISHPDAFHSVVCNPAAGEWVAVPPLNIEWGSKTGLARLGFDPAVSCHFHVFQFIHMPYNAYVEGVYIYSSQTGEWSHKESGWGYKTRLETDMPSVFFNGLLHSVTNVSAMVAFDAEGNEWRTDATGNPAMVVVNTEGNAWRNVPVPGRKDSSGFIGLSQGRVCLVNRNEDNEFVLSIWVLQDYGGEEWILKHSVSFSLLFGETNVRFGFPYEVIAVHPDCNLIFFACGWNYHILMSYQMDRGEVCEICNLGHRCLTPCQPYVPLFAKSLAGGQ